jgi:hypothetical protein
MSSYNIIKTLPKVILNNKEHNKYVSFNTYDTYDFMKTLWISKISVIDNNLIMNSNHFIDTNIVGEYQETGYINAKTKYKPHFIYSRIIKNYLILKEHKNEMTPYGGEDRPCGVKAPQSGASSAICWTAPTSAMARCALATRCFVA